VAETVIFNGNHIGYQFAKKSMGERRLKRKVYHKDTRPYCYFQGRKVYLRSVSGSRYVFETTRNQYDSE
jgi:hypothetical protein